jgi:tetratricopeptide (TPR) repeat protein
VAARPAAAAEEPWEAAIRDGIVEQDAQIAQSGVKRVIAVLEGRASRNPDVVNLYLLARAYAKAKEYTDAFAEYPEVLKVQPRCYFAYRDLGWMHFEQAQKSTPPDPSALAKAEQSLEQARRLKRGYVEALRPLAEVKKQRKDYGGAEVVLQEILDVAPRDDTARAMIAEVQFMQGKFDEALRGISLLLAKDPRNPDLLHLKGRILVAKREFDEAKKVFRSIAEANPSARPPLVAFLDACQKSTTTTVDELLWALESFLRLARTAEERTRIAAELERLRQGKTATPAASAPGPSAPPDTATIVKLLNAPDAAQRGAILRVLWRALPPGIDPKELLGPGLLPRLYDPVVDHRKYALRLYGKYGGPNTVALARLGLKDGDAGVKAVAADAIGQIGNIAGIAALTRSAYDADDVGGVGVAARSSIYQLAGVAPPEAAETGAAQAAVFKAWWESPDLRDLKTRIVQAVLETQDHFAEELLIGFALEDDPAVSRAAYAGLRQVSAAARGATRREEWLRTLPALAEGAFVGPSAAGTREAIARWWAGRPK